MNERIEKIAKETNFTLIDSPIWRNQLERFVTALILDISKNVEHIEVWDSNLGEFIKEKYLVDKISK